MELENHFLDFDGYPDDEICSNEATQCSALYIIIGISCELLHVYKTGKSCFCSQFIVCGGIIHILHCKLSPQ